MLCSALLCDAVLCDPRSKLKNFLVRSRPGEPPGEPLRIKQWPGKDAVQACNVCM